MAKVRTEADVIQQLVQELKSLESQLQISTSVGPVSPGGNEIVPDLLISSTDKTLHHSIAIELKHFGSPKRLDLSTLAVAKALKLRNAEREVAYVTDGIASDIVRNGLKESGVTLLEYSDTKEMFSQVKGMVQRSILKSRTT